MQFCYLGPQAMSRVDCWCFVIAMHEKLESGYTTYGGWTFGEFVDFQIFLGYTPRSPSALSPLPSASSSRTLSLPRLSVLASLPSLPLTPLPPSLHPSPFPEPY